MSVADAVTAVPGVAALHPGFGVEVATQFSGGKVVGVSLTGESVQVYITVDAMPLPAVADAAARAAAAVLEAVGDNRPVDVVVADVTPAAMERRSSSRG